MECNAGHLFLDIMVIISLLVSTILYRIDAKKWKGRCQLMIEETVAARGGLKRRFTDGRGR